MRNYYNYYLVALNLYEDKRIPRIINLNNDMLKISDEKELTNLAFIDNLTSKYDEGVFRRYLYDKEILENIYTPVAIVRLSNSYTKNIFGNKKSVTSVKFYSPIFKSKDSKLINNIALTTIRQRNLSISDSAYLLQHFEELYFNNLEYMKIVNYILNQHDIKHLLNYHEYIKDKKSNPIKYDLLRQVVSSIYEYEKYKSFDGFIDDVYGRNDYIQDIIKILPEKIRIKREDLNPVNRLSKDETNIIKNEEWDDIEAKEEFKKGKFSERKLLTLTLEDKLRAGIINYQEYINAKEKYEMKFRK